MARGIQKWTDETIERMQREGRGEGSGPTYLPWIAATDFYSTGRSHRLYSHKTGRAHELLSDAERDTFLMLEASRSAVDIREQFPIDRQISTALAAQIGIRHPCYPRTKIPCVLTADLLVNRTKNGSEHLEFFSVKTRSALEDTRTIEKLELERSIAQALEMSFHLVVKEMIPMVRVRNLEWIRDAQLEQDASEAQHEQYRGHMSRMLDDLRHRRVGLDASLADYCTSYDQRFSLQTGTAMRVARMLLASRALSMDFNNPSPSTAPMSSFVTSALPGQLRVAGA